MGIIVYRMGRLCGGAHEISGIRPHIFSVVGGWRVLGVGGMVADGWVGVVGVCVVFGWVVLGWVRVGGVSGEGWGGGWVVRGGGGGVNIMKDLKYEHESIFPLWGRVKLNFQDR